MPILAVDQNGQIYVTSADRADGMGYSSSPECVTVGDLTLGAAYLKSQSRQNQSLLHAHRQQRLVDAKEARDATMYRKQIEKEARKARAEDAMYANPETQERLLRRAVGMNGCGCESVPTGMSGNAMTANGQTGFAGMSRDQQTIYNALTGRGNATAFGVDPVEQEQAQHKMRANRILRSKAR